MDDFEKELKVGFLDEAGELLVSAEQCFLRLEREKDDPAVIENIFRLAHNLKGSAGAVGFMELSHFIHALESFLLRIKNGDLDISNEVVTTLLACNDFLATSVEALKSDLDAKIDPKPFLEKFEKLSNKSEPAVVESKEVPLDEQMAELTSAHLAQESSLQNQVEETPFQIAATSPSPSTENKPKGSNEENVRVSLAKIDELLNNVGELVILQTVMNQQKAHIHSHFAQKTVGQMAKIVREIQEASMGLRMLPLKQTFQKMQRIVRDTSKALNKEVELHLVGEETELDKTVIERLSDPLVHLVRNAVDHGLETPDARSAAGKPEMGNIYLSAYHRGSQIVIEIKDDGAGLDAERLIQKAREKGIIDANSTLTKDQAHQLIFAPGFSTKAEVTDISGRGVGMDVVKTNIKSLQGEIELETTPGKGSCFRVVLPLTLAIIDAMIVTLNEERFVIPKFQVLETLQPVAEDIGTAAGRGEILHLRGQHMPLFRLESLLGRSVKETKPSWERISLVVDGGRAGAFSVLVDDIVGQHQVVVKRLGEEIQGLKGVSGAAILGDGKASLILDLLEMNSSKNKVAS